MKQKLHTIATAVLAVIFVFSLGMVVYYRLQSAANARSIEEARQLAMAEEPPAAPAASDPASVPAPAAPDPVEPEPPEEPEKTEDERLLEGLQIDLEALQEVNEDVIGWLVIPDTEISYPLVQGEDNEYYLTHGWDKKRNSAGAIFMDYTCAGDLSDPYTILYGHNMKDGTMFRTLWQYREQDFWEAHPRVYVLDGGGAHRYDIFAVWEPDSSSSTFHPDQLADSQARQKLTDRSLSYSAVDTGITPEAPEQILALSTCSGSGYATRWVVFAVARELETSANLE